MKVRAAIALLIITLSASIGIAARLYVPNPLGNSIFVITRICLLVTPVVWFVVIDRRQLRWQHPRMRDVTAGLWVGLAMAGAIVGAYGLVGVRWLDPSTVQAAAQTVGLASPWAYTAFAIYFTVVNAFVEEYIWRWFVYQKWTQLVPAQHAIWLSAGCFTLHHIIALAGYTGHAVVTVLGSIGVFIAGAVWSWCLLRYRTLWASYISHALADLAIALVGWHLLF
ncbi:MAG: type II CAAX endopeptidase family protein [Cyanobacteria bacterium J06626_14]